MKKRTVLVTTGLVAGIAGTIAVNPVAQSMGIAASSQISAAPVSLTTSTGAAPTRRSTKRKATPAAAAPAAPRTITGAAVQEPYGTVQAAITVQGKQITGVNVVQVPGGFDQQFADASIPTLTQEILSSQSANVSVVSGATYVSSAFLQSVDSAIQHI